MQSCRKFHTFADQFRSIFCFRNLPERLEICWTEDLGLALVTNEAHRECGDKGLEIEE